MNSSDDLRDSNLWLHFTCTEDWRGAAPPVVANIGVSESHGLLGNVQRNEEWLCQGLRELMSRHEIIVDVRGTGYFWAVEPVADREHKVMFDDDQSERLLRGFLSKRTLELALICRVEDRDEGVIQISPPLIAGRTLLGEMLDKLDEVLGEAMKHLQSGDGAQPPAPSTNEAVAL